MRANELRIGNFVKRHDTNEIVEIEELWIWGSKDDGTQLASIGKVSISYFVPIPLTEKCLLVFGFKVNDGKSYSTGEEVNFKWYQKSELTYNSIQGNWWLGRKVIKKLKHVHELQNLYFSLTGEELTIEQND